jgi:dipeptidyl aminopeptidase/acylaminoacyl peptidase
MRLIDLSRTLPGTDGDRVFLLGQSRGAMMSYLVARRRSDITAMATIAGATDLGAGLAWRPEMERVYRARIPGYADDKPAALRERSALRWAEHLPAGMPVLLLHGEADDRVSVDDSRAMAARLRQLDRPHRLVVYPGDDHSLRQNRRAAHAEIVAWFRSAGTAAAEAAESRSSLPAIRRSAEQPATASTGPTGAEHVP